MTLIYYCSVKKNYNLHYARLTYAKNDVNNNILLSIRYIQIIKISIILLMHCCNLMQTSNDSVIEVNEELNDNLDDLDDFVILDKMNTLNITSSINTATNNNAQTDIHTFLFDAHKYMDEILASYSYDATKILEQVYLDYCRTSVYCNNILIRSVGDFIRHNDAFNSKIYEAQNSLVNNSSLSKINNEYNFLIILLMLCCQSSYGLHYMSLKDIYCEPTTDLLLCSSNDNRRTHFVIKDNVLSVTIETNLIIKDTISNTVVKKINTKVIIDSYLDNINKQGHCNFNEYGLFYWNVL